MIEKTFVKQGLKKVQLHQYLKSELGRAGFTGFEMVKTPLVTRIIVNVSRPGLAIGKGGQNIRSLTDAIQKNYGVDNPQLEIREIANPDLDAKSVADRVKNSIERGFTWRSVAFRTLSDIERAGAEGVEIVLSGKLAGKGGRKRQVRFAKGYMKKVGEQRFRVDEAKVTMYPKVGAIGLTVRIIAPGTYFPDKVDIRPLLAARKTLAAAPEGTSVETPPQGEDTPTPETTSPTPENESVPIKGVAESQALPSPNPKVETKARKPRKKKDNSPSQPPTEETGEKESVTNQNISIISEPPPSEEKTTPAIADVDVSTPTPETTEPPIPPKTIEETHTPEEKKEDAA
ncbi:MAG: 30S ribosomal protein S3 [Candidatus Diapherotrites archaeon]|nr:30S ribosomal protein S3 [Candidatus Diapherotrites archaeon]MDZ4256384.1 30S ribosomal protein S3 [archaeon]